MRPGQQDVQINHCDTASAFILPYRLGKEVSYDLPLLRVRMSVDDIASAGTSVKSGLRIGVEPSYLFLRWAAIPGLVAAITLHSESSCFESFQLKISRHASAPVMK